MVVGAIGIKGNPLGHQRLGQSLGILDNLAGVLLEGGLQRLGQGNRLCRHHLGKRPPDDQWASLVDTFGIFLLAQDHAATGATKGLVGRGGHDVGPPDRVVVTAKDATGDQTGEMGHVDHEGGSHLLGDLAHAAEVDLARVSGVSGNQDQRLDLHGQLLDGIIVKQLGLLVDGVAVGIEHLGGDVLAIAMGQMSARIIVQAKDALVAKHVAQVVPVLLLHLARIGLAEFLHLRHLDAGVQDGPIGAQVGVGTAMWLDIGVLRPEQLAGLLVGEGLDGVDIVAAGVEAVIRKSFAVLVGQQVPHGALHGKRGEVLAGDQLQMGALVRELLDNPSCDKW